MLTVQHLFRLEGIVSDAKGQVPLQTSVEFVSNYNAQAYAIVDAISVYEQSAKYRRNTISRRRGGDGPAARAAQ